jgi:hypothetical protein
MSSAALRWIDAKTPHAKVFRDEELTPSIELRNDVDVQAAIARIKAFQARITREALEKPLVIVEAA